MAWRAVAVVAAVVIALTAALFVIESGGLGSKDHGRGGNPIFRASPSPSAARVVVPSVIGLPPNNAKNVVSQLGFNTEMRQETPTTGPTVLVVAQRPVAGSTAASGSTVTLIVASPNHSSRP